MLLTLTSALVDMTVDVGLKHHFENAGLIM
jgi:hypothetical protein